MQGDKRLEVYQILSFRILLTVEPSNRIRVLSVRNQITVTRETKMFNGPES